MDKLKFYQEATYYISLVADNVMAMGDVFTFLSRNVRLDSMSWHFYDRNESHLRIAGVITPKGFLDLNNRIVPLTKRACKYSDEIDVQKFVHIENANQNPLAKKIVQALSDFVGPGEKSLLIIYLEWKDKLLGHLCLFRNEPGQWPEDHLSLLKMLKPPFSFAIYHLQRLMELTLQKNQVIEEKELLAQELRRITDYELIGAESGLREITTSIEQLALVDSPVLIMGETGVGKELVANAIQQASQRRNGPFVKVNCGAIPDTLIDSELFGYERGAFTGASNLKRGKFELAHGGTLFLDEIGELPAQAQVRLLRVLQNQKVDRIGGARPIEVDVRFIAATHRDLMELLRKGSFREDLFFRINVFPIIVPPLRHRMQDIPALVAHLIKKKVVDMKLHKAPKLEVNALESLLNHKWPGNVRELENLVERALILRPKGPVSFDGLLQNASSTDKQEFHDKDAAFYSLDDINRKHIERALLHSQGRINGPQGAAELLRIKPNTLRRRMDKLGIPYGRKQKNLYLQI